MNGLRGARKAAAALAASAVAVLLPLGGTTALAADESPGPAAVDVTPLEKVNALVQPSVVFLLQTWDGYVYDTFNKQYLNDGNPFELQFQCTGFVVNPNGYIATAGHCVDFKEVEGSFVETAAQWALANGYYSSTTLTLDDIVGFDDYRIESSERKNTADLDIQVGWGASVSGIETSEVKRARVIDFDRQSKGDVALIKVEATDLNALPMATDEVDVGTDVVSIGYPASVDSVTDPNLTPSFKDGSISSVKTVQGGVLPVYEISAAVSGGMSGGPSVNLDGEVIGVNSFGILGEPQAFNFLRPSSQLAELMAGAGVTNELSETTQAYRDGLLAYWAGDRTTAVDKLGSVVDEQPTNKLAAEFLEKAQDLPEPPPAEESDSGLPVVPIVIGVAVLVLVGGGLLAFLLLRRKGGSSPAATPPAAPVAPATPAAPAAPLGGPYAAPYADPVSSAPAAPLGFSGGVTTAPPPTIPPTIPPTSPAAPPPTPVPTASVTPPPAAPAPAPAPASTPVSASGPLPTPPVASEEPAEKHEPHFCGNCGEPAEHGKKFCSNCGSPLA
ncbi:MULTISPECIES: trypsin-like peptidase domain-containing protein [unclassified Nocardioides]|uniref:trypsin-like peptidase domain-containing protein n=1 Tax=unclassified Nocardioides TaxID=2615069 RepID=UPI0000571DF1|nr:MULTISPECIES: trypsin-like peptidase domain-containing protein [unclassified Nocardioides]ABL81900.1 peptidase S1 and S6, chymotrypsin/Hap [Nocardioides sp. JS614]